MKKIGMYLLKCAIALVVFLVITIIFYYGMGFLYIVEKTLIFTLATILVDLLFVIVKEIIKRYKKSKK